jgi:DNA-directed RNA polymerase specialized sigma24 family protein
LRDPANNPPSDRSLSLHSLNLLERWREGDEQAADELFEAYIDGLLAYVRRRMSPALARRLDPEDVVQSVYRSFFSRARDGQYVIERSGDLWRLLLGISFNKLQSQVEHHTAGKRSYRKESHASASEDPHIGGYQPAAGGPTVEEVLAVSEELERLVASLPERHREILDRRLQGESIPDIAAAVGRSERSIRRVLNACRDDLEARFHSLHTQ